MKYEYIRLNAVEYLLANLQDLIESKNELLLEYKLQEIRTLLYGYAAIGVIRWRNAFDALDLITLQDYKGAADYLHSLGVSDNA